MGGGPVVIQVGQCGNGVGASLWKHVAQELANGAHPRNLGASAREYDVLPYPSSSHRCWALPGEAHRLRV